ncbi:MAG TPA: DUF4105 domain-containing protein [Gemmatimonadaceae bacterium]|nr:DUF4105 domain-containing protein [Gemmatimonadaceae bacterium]
MGIDVALRGGAMRRLIRGWRGCALLIAVAVWAAWVSLEPTHDRTWLVEQSVLPKAEFEGSLVRLTGVRSNTYTARTVFSPSWTERRVDLDRLTSAWFVLTPFSTGWRGPAHSFVTFGFSDSQFVAISVEARREPGEAYGVLAGLFKRFELMYVVGDERDLIGQRAAYDSTDVYLYPIRATPERIRAVFVEMLERVNELHDGPEFYNTLTNNCTSNLIRHVNQVTPDRVPTGWRTIVPGYSDEVAHRLGLIDTELGIAQARARYRVNDLARRYIADSLFSLRIRGID